MYSNYFIACALFVIWKGKMAELLEVESQIIINFDLILCIST